MRVKFAIGNNKINHWDFVKEFHIPSIPLPIKECYVSVEDLLDEKDLQMFIDSSDCWSNDNAEVVMVILKKDIFGWYYWIWLNCEDK